MIQAVKVLRVISDRRDQQGQWDRWVRWGRREISDPRVPGVFRGRPGRLERQVPRDPKV